MEVIRFRFIRGLGWLPDDDNNAVFVSWLAGFFYSFMRA